MEKDPTIPFTPIPVTWQTGPRPGYCLDIVVLGFLVFS